MKKQKAKKVTVKKARAGEVVQATKTHAVISHDDGKLGLSEGLIAHHRIGEKGKPGGAPVKEVRSRDEIDRGSGRMTRVEQSFDRQNDHTKKVVTFQDTGEVKFSREGKLSEENKPK
jgi:hypothetical protein